MRDEEFFARRRFEKARKLVKEVRRVLSTEKRLYWKVAGYTVTFRFDRELWDCTCRQASVYGVNRSVPCEHVLAVIGREIGGVKE